MSTPSAPAAVPSPPVRRTLVALRDVLAVSGARAPLRVVGGPAAAALVAGSLHARGGAVAALASEPGLLAALEDLVEADISGPTLAEAEACLGRPGALAEAVEVARERLAASGAELASARWRRATDVLRRGWPDVLDVGHDGPALEVELAPPAGPAQVAFLAALARAASAAGRALVVHVALSGDAAVDAPLEPFLAALESADELPGVELRPELPGDEAPLARALAALAAAPGDVPVPQGALDAFAAASPQREAGELVRGLRRALAAGAPPSACALVAIAPDATDACVRALDAAGLPVGARPPVPLAATGSGRIGLVWARLPGRRFPADEVAWLLVQRLLPGLSSGAPREAAALLRRAGVRDAALGAQGDRDAYDVRLSALAERLGASTDARRARALATAVAALERLAAGLPGRAPLASHLEAWRAGLAGAGLWTALDEAPFDAGVVARRTVAREAAALETWRAFVRDVRAGWKAARDQGPVMDAAGFARWLEDAAGALPVHVAGAPGGVDVLALEDAATRRLAYAGLAGLDAASLPRPPGPTLLDDGLRRAVDGLVGRPVLPTSVGVADVRAPVHEALERWRLGRVLVQSERVSVGRRRSAAGAPADLVTRLLSVTGVHERELDAAPVPPLAECADAGSARVRVALEASVAPALRTTDVDATGAAAAALRVDAPWLVEARALAGMEAERLRARAGLAPPGPASGALGDAALVAAVTARLGGAPETPLSATSLAALANCGFQGLARKVLQLEPPDAPGEELDARARGQLLHGALELLVRRLRESGGLAAAAARPPRVVDGLLAAVVAEAAERQATRAATGHPRTWALAQRRALRILERLVATGRLFPFAGLLPEETEAAFGRPEASEEWRVLVLPAAFPGESPVWFRGSIDRIDRGPGGTAVIDYKSSKRRGDAQEGLLDTDFQLPLYLHALQARGERPPFRAGWLSLRSLELVPLEPEWTGPLDRFLATDAATRAVLEGAPNLATAVHGTLREAREGRYPVRPRDCGFCGLGSVCRISERAAPDDGPRGATAAAPTPGGTP